MNSTSARGCNNNGVTSLLDVFGTHEKAVMGCNHNRTLIQRGRAHYTRAFTCPIPLTPINGNNNSQLGSENTTMEWRLDDQGDALVGIVFMYTQPAVPTSGLPSGVRAFHFQNKVAMAYAQEISLKTGTTVLEKYTPESSERWYATKGHGVMNAWREAVGDFCNEAELVAASRNAQVFLQPCYFECCGAIDSKFSTFEPVNAMFNSDLKLCLKPNPSSQWSVAVGNKDASRALITAPTVTPFGIYLFLNEAERSYIQDVDHCMAYRFHRVEDPVTTTASDGSTFTNQNLVSIHNDHLTIGMYWCIRSAAALDGTTYQLGKIGTYDRFYYGHPETNGESVSRMCISAGQTGFWDGTVIPAMWFRTYSLAMAGVRIDPSRNIYGHFFGPFATTSDPSGYYNFSTTDTNTASYQANHSTASSFYIEFVNRAIKSITGGNIIVPYVNY